MDEKPFTAFPKKNLKLKSGLPGGAVGGFQLAAGFVEGRYGRDRLIDVVHFARREASVRIGKAGPGRGDQHFTRHIKDRIVVIQVELDRAVASARVDRYGELLAVCWRKRRNRTNGCSGDSGCR